MICFTIALRSEESSKNWDKVLFDFNNTLDSIFNQTHSEFRVYVGCNKIPFLFKSYDDRLCFIEEQLPIPKTWEECCRDRSWKLLLCAKKIKEDFKDKLKQDGIYVFPVDADDFVNRNIAKYCADNPNAYGFKSKTGYLWRKGNRYFEITKYFGGTMNIMKMYDEDFPSELPPKNLCFDKQTAMNLTKRYPIRWYDIEVENKFSQIGRPLERLPFRSTIYVLNTGNNISNNDSTKTENENKIFHPIAFLRKISPFNKKRICKRIIKEFGMPNVKEYYEI